MSDRSSIEWTDATWNPIRARRRDTGKIGWHCEHVSEGCRNCYAETFNRRGLPNGGTGLAYKPGHRADVEIFLDDRMLLQPLRWRRPRRVFLGSMTDVFADFVTDAMIDRIFAVMALCPQHTFQVLTKRPERMRAYVGTPDRKRTIASAVMRQMSAQQAGSCDARIELDHFSACFKGDGPFPNVWLGTSCEDQATADARIPHLLATPAAIRFVSAEPMLGPIDLRTWLSDDDGCEACEDNGPRCNCPRAKAVWLDGVYDYDDPSTCWTKRVALDLIIVGGESGPHARPLHQQWVRDIRDPCAAAGVAFFFKQWGGWLPYQQWETAASAGKSLWRTDWMILDQAGGLDIPDDRWPDDEAGEVAVLKVGKARAGRLLDGVEHNGMPNAHRRPDAYDEKEVLEYQDSADG